MEVPDITSTFIESYEGQAVFDMAKRCYRGQVNSISAPSRLWTSLSEAALVVSLLLL